MSVATYIQKLRDKQELSYMQLAKDIGITYQNMMDLKNDRIAFVSPTVLKKLSKYEKRNQEDIIFDILKDDVTEDYSLLSLKYICNKYIEGYSFTINPSIPSPFIVGQIVFDGFLLKKRTGNNYIAVDSWRKLKEEHWEIFRLRTGVPYSRDAYVEIFLNDEMYFSNIIAWAAQRILVSTNKSIKAYDILFEKDIDSYDYNIVKQFLVSYTGFKISLLLQ